jgi:hypothetical protein
MFLGMLGSTRFRFDAGTKPLVSATAEAFTIHSDVLDISMIGATLLVLGLDTLPDVGQTVSLQCSSPDAMIGPFPAQVVSARYGAGACRIGISFLPSPLKDDWERLGKLFTWVKAFDKKSPATDSA